MLGLELTSRSATESFVTRCMDRGILLGWTLHSDTLVRVAPPLNIPFDVLEEALSVMRSVLDEVA